MIRSVALISAWLVLGLAACAPGTVGQGGSQTRGTTAGGGGGRNQSIAAVAKLITDAKAITNCGCPRVIQGGCQGPWPGKYQQMVALYDGFFAGEVDFGWQAGDAGLREMTGKVVFLPFEAGQAPADWPALADFNACSFQRTRTESNAALITAINWNNRRSSRERFNPSAWSPGALTGYSRFANGSSRDVMAEQFVFSAACDTRVQDGLRQCANVTGGCHDAFTALSPNDKGKLFEVRFTDPQQRHSKIFRFISVDSGSATDVSCNSANPVQTGCLHTINDGQEGRIYTSWRGELSGRFYQRVQDQFTFGGGTDVLIRASYVNQYSSPACSAAAAPNDFADLAPPVTAFAGGPSASTSTGTPGTDTPGTDTPAADTPAADTPAADTPAAEPAVDLPSCAAVARDRGWRWFACEKNGNNACGVTDGDPEPAGEETSDCDVCCFGPPNEDGIGRTAALPPAGGGTTTIPDGEPPAAGGTPTPAGGTGTFRSHNTINLNIRAAANTGAQILGTIAPNTCVEKLGEANGWWNVRYNGLVGWSSTGNGAWLNQTTTCN